MMLEWNKRAGGAIREARLRKGWTQTEAAAAAAIDVPQPLMSRLENGDGSALPEEKIRALADALEVDLERILAEAAREEPSVRHCASPTCAGNLPYFQANRIVIKPRFVETNEPRCGMCGQVLISKCRDCGAPIPGRGSLCCAQCGAPYVDAPEDEDIDLGNEDPRMWCQQQRDESLELTDMPEPEKLRGSRKGNER